MDAPQHKLLVLEETTLTAMANDARFAQAFPFLKGLRQVPQKRCGMCGTANRVRAGSFQTAKQTLAALGPDQKLVLKKLLNAKNARVIYRRGDGKMIALTF